MSKKLEKYKNEIDLFIKFYKDLHKYYKNGLIFSQYCEGFNSLNEKEKDYVLKLSKYNFIGSISLIKDSILYNNKKNNSVNLWTFWGCKISDLRKLNIILTQYLEYLTIK